MSKQQSGLRISLTPCRNLYHISKTENCKAVTDSLRQYTGWIVNRNKKGECRMERYGNESYKTENCKTENDKSENSNLENYQIENCKAENNLVLVRGEIATEITFSHRNYGENFYRLEMAVKRRSDYMDRIPVIFSEQMIDVTQGHVGQEIEIQGQFRSRNQWEENHSRLLLSVFARSLRLADADRGEDSFNEIFLNGFLCKPPLYRITSSGREITELLLAVNRRYGGKQTIFPPSAGGIMRDMPRILQWGSMCRSGDAYRAGNISNSLPAARGRRERLTKFRSSSCAPRHRGKRVCTFRCCISDQTEVR